MFYLQSPATVNVRRSGRSITVFNGADYCGCITRGAHGFTAFDCRDRCLDSFRKDWAAMRGGSC
jgi:hypothetical protein